MEGTDATDPEPVVEAPEITSAASTGPGPAITSGGSGRGDGSEASSSPWSLTKEEQVHNMKENFIRAFNCRVGRAFPVFIDENEVETSPWFASVVEKLRAGSFSDSCDIEIDSQLFGGMRYVSGLRMTSLDAAILMGDLHMVQNVLMRVYGGPNDGHPGFADTGVRGLTWFRVTAPGTLSRISDDRKKTVLLFTPLHLAVAGGDSHIVDELLLWNADVNARNWWWQTPLHLAWELGDLAMLQKLLEKDRVGKKPIHVAVQCGDVELMKNLPSPNINALDKWGRTPLHYLATKWYYDGTKMFEYLAKDIGLDVTALDGGGLSAFYVTVLSGNTKLVTALLHSFKGQIRLNEESDEDRGPPIQIAFEGGHSFKDIERALMECEPVKGYMDKLYRDRQVYVDAANAILVGAALIASVTFASWLQPPLNYTSYFGDGYSSTVPAPSTSNLNYADVQHNIALRAFWVFNALSFYFAIATVVCGARSVLPRSHLFIKKTVEKLRTNLLVTSIFLACSVLFVIIAFAIAGTIVLTPLLKYQWCMIVPTLVGGMVCIISLGFLMKSMKEIYSNARDSSDNRLNEAYLEDIGYIVLEKEITSITS